MANSDNITLRIPSGQTLSYEQLDANFQELINIINDYNSFYVNEFKRPTLYMDNVSGIFELDVSEYKSYVITMAGNTTISFTGQETDIMLEVWIKAVQPDFLTFDGVNLDQEYFQSPSSNYALYQLVWIDNQWQAKIHSTG